MSNSSLFALSRLGTLFYVVPPSSSTFKNVGDVPNYINEAVPWFTAIIILEEILAKLQGGQAGRMSDNLTSLGHAILYESMKVMTRWWEMSGYLWLYQYRLLHLEWASPWTWWAGFIVADFVYYWFHRAAHEVSVIWSWHQVHHSHEDYNMTVALRQSMFQRLMSFGFYQPWALLGVPLPAICVHWQLNLLVQFVIHTELVRKLGPLEWILNTPSHHRVHHGANKYCLDKNYGGFLIIWDRMFGTFEAEDEEVVYGLVDQPQTNNILWLQFFYIRDILRKAKSMSTWGDSVRALMYGPGWSPGTPRLGDIDTFPDVKAPRAKYDPQLPLFLKCYTGAHYLVTLLLQQVFTWQYPTLSYHEAAVFFGFLLFSVQNTGLTYDGWRWVPLLEVVRCAAYVIVATSHPMTAVASIDALLITFYALSSLIWVNQIASLMQVGTKLRMD